MKMGDSNRPVETGEVYHRPPTLGDLGSDKEAAVVAQRRRSQLDGLLLAQICHRSRQSYPPDGRREVAGE